MRKTRVHFAAIFSLAVCVVSMHPFRAAAQGVAPRAPEAVQEGRAAEAPQAAQARSLNNYLLLLHSQMQAALPSEVGSVRGRAARVIAQRAAALADLIKANPRAALSFAFSPELLADLAAKFPQSASLLESHLTVRGQLEHWIEDAADLKTSRSYFRLKVGQQTLNLYFAGPEPVLQQEALLEATGVVVGSDMAVSSSKTVFAAGSASAPGTPTTPRPFANLARYLQWPIPTDLMGIFLLALIGLAAGAYGLRRHIGVALKQPVAYAVAISVIVLNSPISYAQTSTCSTTGAQNTAVLLVDFSDESVSVTTQQAYDAFFDTSTGVSVNGFWQEASFGQTWATGNVLGPFTIGPSTSYTCSNIVQIFYDAVTAAKNAGVNLQGYTRMDVIFPGLSCGWAGLTSTGSAGAGCNNWSTAEGTLTASVSFLPYGYFTENVVNAPSIRDQAVMLCAHENGHQLGLNHSGTINDYPTAVLGPLTSPGTITEFNDYFSVMGGWTLGLYPAEQRAEILNWIAPTTNYLLVESSGTYTLQPIETSPPGLKALKVLRGSGNTGYYLWVEYRQPLGNYDSTITYMNFNGALVHYEDPTIANYTHVLDFTPSDVGYWYNTVLAPGQTWTDLYSNVSISITSATSSGLTVSVNYGAEPCTQAHPTLSISPSDPSLSAGSSTNYTASVTNNNSAGCSSSTFDLSSSQPSGWSGTFSTTNLTLSPGQSGSATLSEAAPSATSPGTYAIGASATNAANSSFVGSATANATVVAAPSLAVSVAVSGSTFTSGQKVTCTANVLNGGTAAGGASVTFTMTEANGSKTSKTVTANSSGVATWSYKIGPKDPKGTWSAVAQATFNSQTATSNTATFTVQ